VGQGPGDADRAYAEAVKRSIKKFGARLVAEKAWSYDPGARRTDTGHFSIAAEAARFTQGLSYDVLVVADEAGEFGNDLSYRTTEPRPVAGTQGLVPTAWARPYEQWGATQLQNRFRRHPLHHKTMLL
jgi:ABC transporter substrate binding protein (PQQ-dependent alcohol dehydrogenase system)